MNIGRSKPSHQSYRRVHNEVRLRQASQSSCDKSQAHSPCYLNSIPIIVLSRFILHLRRCDRNARTVESRASRFDPSGFHISVSSEGFISDIGQPLDHAFHDHDSEPDEDHVDGVDAQLKAGSSAAHTRDETMPSGFSTKRCVLSRGFTLVLC